MAKQRASKNTHTLTQAHTWEEEKTLQKYGTAKGAKNVNAFAHINETRSCANWGAHSRLEQAVRGLAGLAGLPRTAEGYNN